MLKFVVQRAGGTSSILGAEDAGTGPSLYRAGGGCRWTPARCCDATINITSTHRGHGHCPAKVGVAGQDVAELLGKMVTARGKGGSMHIADQDTGNLGATAIVSGSAGIVMVQPCQRRCGAAIK